MNCKEKVAQALLTTEAVRLNVGTPFTFVSGIKSPIYCDNRKVIGFVHEREIIINEFIKKIEKMEDSGRGFDVIAGTSTAGIPWAAYISDKLKKPMAYIRGEKKAHGTGKQIEGADFNGKNILIIEDLISTGGSSIKAVDVAKENGAKDIFVLAIFSYEFEKAYTSFKNAETEWTSLSNFPSLLEVAKENSYITEEELNIAKKWNLDPSKY
jgi:orotate phosphoribosyltransferase